MRRGAARAQRPDFATAARACFDAALAALPRLGVDQGDDSGAARVRRRDSSSAGALRQTIDSTSGPRPGAAPGRVGGRDVDLNGDDAIAAAQVGGALERSRSARSTSSLRCRSTISPRSTRSSCRRWCGISRTSPTTRSSGSCGSSPATEPPSRDSTTSTTRSSIPAEIVRARPPRSGRRAGLRRRRAQAGPRRTRRRHDLRPLRQRDGCAPITSSTGWSCSTSTSTSRRCWQRCSSAKHLPAPPPRAPSRSPRRGGRDLGGGRNVHDGDRRRTVGVRQREACAHGDGRAAARPRRCVYVLYFVQLILSGFRRTSIASSPLAAILRSLGAARGRQRRRAGRLRAVRGRRRSRARGPVRSRRRGPGLDRLVSRGRFDRSE